MKYTHGNLQTESLPGNKNKRILRDFGCIDNRGVEWVVPAGTETDGKSVPKWSEIIVGDPFDGDTEEGSCIHDYFCVTKTRSQKDTHRIFRELCEFEGVPKWKAYAMWAAVRAYNRVKNPKWA